MSSEKYKPAILDEATQEKRNAAIRQYSEKENLRPTPETSICDPQTVLSVVIPTYNEENFIGNTLLSLGRSEAPIEIIVVDNGSEDRIKSVVTETAKQIPYPVTILHCNVRGPVHARKRGMDEVLAHYLYKTDTTNPRYIGMTDADTQVPANWSDVLFQTLSNTAAAAGGGLFYFPTELDELIESEVGIKDYFKLIPSLAYFLATNGASIIHTYGANAAIEVAAYASIGGSQQPVDGEGKPVKGSDLRFGDAVRSAGQLVSFLPIFTTTSARREVLALSQKKPQHMLSSMEGWVDTRETDLLFLGQVIHSLQRDDFLRHREERLISFIYRNVIFPILTKKIAIDGIEKILGSDNSFLLTLYTAKEQINGKNEDEIRLFSRALAKANRDNLVEQLRQKASI